MYLKHSCLHHQKGLGLPSALFLILVVTLLLAVMNQLNEMNARAYSRDWLSARAFYVAETGAQIAAVQALNPDQAMTNCSSQFINNLNMNVVGLSGCRINVSCLEQTVQGQIYYTFTSRGSCGENEDMATRFIQIRVAP